MSAQRHVRLFRNGRNQAVRIPVEFELPGSEAIMHRDGDRLVPVIGHNKKNGKKAMRRKLSICGRRPDIHPTMRPFVWL